jgi:hypothetical protein
VSDAPACTQERQRLVVDLSGDNTSVTSIIVSAHAIIHTLNTTLDLFGRSSLFIFIYV